MSGYNMEYFITDFAARTQVNLNIINAIANENTNKAYEVTQLINSFLGLVVLPNEKYKKWDEKKSQDMKKVEGEIWSLVKDCEKDHRYFNSFRDRNSGKVLEFITHLRNSVSHSGTLGLHFYPVTEGGDKNITHIIFYDSNYYMLKAKNNDREQLRNNSREFCLKLTVEEAKRMVTYIADLYRLVDKSNEKDTVYESKIRKLDDLLCSGRTSQEGTVAEMIDRALHTEE